MGDRTGIEWTDATWNPVTGCTKVSPGCDNCYAETTANRFAGTPGHYYERGFEVTLRPDKLDQPLRWKRRRRVFVNSMSDLFHDAIPDEYIARVWAVMALAPGHTFQVLTKRHARMRSLLSSPEFRQACDDAEATILNDPDMPIPSYVRGQHQNRWWSNFAKPLRNVWLGVSVEDQRWADIRIPALLDTPAAVRFLSCEPLLGPIEIDRYVSVASIEDVKRGLPPLVDWVIVGGESGRAARPMHPDWARSLRDQCEAAGVPFLFKQWGEWVPLGQMPEDTFTAWDARHGSDANDEASLWRVGKRKAGRLLDGRTWDEYPQEVTR